MNLLSPWNLLWLLPIGGAIVALYLLKLRRRDEVVPSVMLWQAAIQDTQANAPFQRLRYNLLLLLQLLVALFLIFAVARPFLWASGLGGRTGAIVLDGSASMTATDEPGGRFASAVAAAKALVRRKAPNDQAAIVLSAEKPVVLAPLTADTGRLMEALDKARPTDATGDIREAITLAGSLVSSHANAQVTVISDGAFGKVDEFSLDGAKLQFLPVGSRSENVGITAFDVRDTVGENARQMFVTVQNFGKAVRTLPLEIRVNANLVDAHEITLKPGESRSETFDNLKARAGGIVTARLDVKDDLSADDAATIVLPPRRPLKILLVSEEGNLFLERALNTDPRVTLDAVTPGGYKPGPGHDLTVFDGGSVPKGLPPGRYLFWGAHTTASDVPATVTGPDAEKPQILDWNRTHPLMRFVDLANVHLLKARAIAPAPWAATLAETDAGSLIVAGERGETKAVYVGFSPLESDMPLRIAFPIFLSNCLQWLTARPGDQGGVYRPGEVIPLAARPAQGPLAITRPDGGRDTLRAVGTPALYDAASRIGIYRATGKGFDQTFSVSLLSPTESNIAPVEKPVFLLTDVGGTKAQNAPRIPVRREIWPWLAGIVLLVLTAEWLIYHRRLG